MEKKAGRAILTILLLIIFWFSSKPSEVSGEQSKRVLVKLRIVTEDEIVNRTPKSMLWRKRIRKSAHLGLFALVGMALYLVTGSLIKSVVIIFIFGSADEIHQYFVPGRGAQMMDVLIDTLGGTVGIFFAKTINYVK